ncbi:hypothetical protein AAVH_00124 [Aphelenchoides avenae]|nr:hypothetical protein AAVH_00124 [Aphelenchus avenae]
MCMPRTFGDPCEVSEQCPPTSLCLSFTCECPKGTKPHNGKCVSEQIVDADRTKERETDEDDKSVEDHTEEQESYEELSTTRKPLHSVSTKHPLTCRQDEVMHQGRCLRKVQLGAVCSTDKQCQHGAKCLHDQMRAAIKGSKFPS